jgi:c-di-GMP-related signal transduction protein
MNDLAQSLREVLIGRQPILDQRQELFGYELLFRANGVHREGQADCPPLAATAGVVCAAFAELGIGNALGPHKAFINADERFILDDALELLPAANVVLELDFTDVPDEALLARCRGLRERGYTLALSRYRGLDARAGALLPLVGIVKIDVLAAGDELPQLAGALTRLPLRLLAEKVETREQMEHCAALGFHYFQGYYFARPTVISGRQLSSSQLGIIRLINLVSREAELPELEDAFKREPGLTVNLLRLVNSVGLGVGRRVDSLRQAVTVLGRKHLLRWLQLLLMASPEFAGAPERNPLLQLAALRGRLMELLASRGSNGNRAQGDQAFLCGIMSLMPAALGLPMNEILEQIAVAREVHEALAEHAGTVGQLLALIEHLDAGDWKNCDLLLARSEGLTRETLTTTLTEALAWIHADGEGNA